MRSSTPPCPGRRWLLSFTPARRLRRLSLRSPTTEKSPASREMTDTCPAAMLTPSPGSQALQGGAVTLTQSQQQLTHSRPAPQPCAGMANRKTKLNPFSSIVT